MTVMPSLVGRADRTSDALRAALTVPVALLAGIATFWLQSALPGWIDPVTNSASGWSLVAIALVALTCGDVVRGVAVATVTFLLLNVGYAVGAALDGLYYDMRIWVVVAVVAGPVVGAAAAVLHRRDVVGSVAHALLGGLFVAEGVRSLATVSDTTSPVYWVLVALLGVAAIVRGAVRVSGRARGVTLAVAAATVGGALLAGELLDRAFAWL